MAMPGLPDDLLATIVFTNRNENNPCLYAYGGVSRPEDHRGLVLWRRLLGDRYKWFDLKLAIEDGWDRFRISVPDYPQFIEPLRDWPVTKQRANALLSKSIRRHRHHTEGVPFRTTASVYNQFAKRRDRTALWFLWKFNDVVRRGATNEWYHMDSCWQFNRELLAEVNRNVDLEDEEEVRIDKRRKPQE
jgi:hypothetical protein